MFTTVTVVERWGEAPVYCWTRYTSCTWLYSRDACHVFVLHIDICMQGRLCHIIIVMHFICLGLRCRYMYGRCAVLHYSRDGCHLSWFDMLICVYKMGCHIKLRVLRAAVQGPRSALEEDGVVQQLVLNLIIIESYIVPLAIGNKLT